MAPETSEIQQPVDMGRSAGRNMATGGMLSVVRLVTGAVRVKVVALAIGASGVGVYALILQLYLTGVALASLSLAVPIITLGRRPLIASEDSEVGSIAGTALVMVLATYAILAVVLGIFGDSMLHGLGIGQISAGLLIPLAVAILFGAVSSAFGEGLSFLCDRFDTYVRVSIIGAIADMLLVGAGAWAFGLRGAIFALPLGPIVIFVAYGLLLRRDPSARRVLANLSFRLAKAPELMTYSAMMLTAAGGTYAALTILRSRLLIEAGATANGYLQTVTSLSAYIFAFVMTGFWGHLYTRAAAAGDTPEVRKELQNSLHLGLLIAFSGCGTAAVLAEYLIPLFYSPDFNGAVGLMIAYMPGELCFQLFSMLTAYQLTVSHRRRYLAWSLGYIGLLLAIGLLAIPRLGAWGYVVGHNVAALITLIIAGFVAWRSGQIRASLLLSATIAVAVLAGMCLALHYAQSTGDTVLRFALLVPVGVSAIALVREFLHRKLA